jgi:hypothetical protein
MNVFRKVRVEFVASPLLKFFILTLGGLHKRCNIISSLSDVINNCGAHRCPIAHVLDPLVAYGVCELDLVLEEVIAGDLLGELLDILEAPLAFNLLVLVQYGLELNFIAGHKLFQVFLVEL